MVKNKQRIIYMKSLLFIISLCFSCAHPQEKQVLPHTLSATVTRIIDGDTFEIVTSNQQTYKVRMNAIDCPERKQPYYQQAKNKLAAYIFGRVVQINWASKDRNQRILGDVYFKNNYINQQLIADGLAWHFKRYNNNPQLAAVEDKAKQEKKGIWQEANPVAPWLYRQQRKTVR